MSMFEKFFGKGDKLKSAPEAAKLPKKNLPSTVKQPKATVDEVIAHAVTEAALFTQPRNGDPKLQKDALINAVVAEKMQSKEAEAFRELIRKELGLDIIQQADAIAEKMRKSGGKGEIAMEGKILHRGDLSKEIFVPHWVKFKKLFDRLPIVDDMERMAEDDSINVGINTHSGIFASNSYLLKYANLPVDEDSDKETNKYDAQTRNEARVYRKAMAGEGAWVSEKNGSPGSDELKSPKRMNPVMFEEADTRLRIDLKILDEIMGGDWTFGTTLELGAHSVYDTGSFTEALTDRLLYIQEKWKALSPEDRTSWLKGGFTHSEEAIQGRYDLVRLASRDHNVG